MNWNLFIYRDKFIIEQIIIIPSLDDIIVGIEFTVLDLNSGRDNWFVSVRKELCLMKNEFEGI